MGADSYEIFVSYRRADAQPVGALVAALQSRGLHVWQDVTAIPEFAGATDEARAGIASSRALLAYYSAEYPLSRACQWELAEGYVAAQRLGDPRERVFVLNPEQGADHIEPVELRDARYVQVTRDDGWIARAADAIERSVGGLDGRLGDAAVEPGMWIPASAISAPRFVGRIRDIWRVHSALSVVDAAMTQATSGPGAVVLRGIGGAGKSLLAQEYALRFAAAYPGGVFWLRARGSEGAETEVTNDEREAERRGQMLTVARALIEPERADELSRADPYEVDAIVRAEIQRRERCLWVVDDLPGGVPAAELALWLGPAPARTLVTTRSGEYGALTNVTLGMLESDEALALLTTRKTPSGDVEAVAAAEIVEELACHPLAVDVASAATRFQSYAELRDGLRDLSADELEMAAGLRDQLPTGHERSISATLNRSIRRLDEPGLDALRVAASLAPQPIPDELLSAVLVASDALSEREARWRFTQGLDELVSLSLAEHAEAGAWTVHALVSRTLLVAGGDVDRRGSLRGAAVKVLDDRIASTRGLQNQVMDLDTHAQLASVLPHARHLAVAVTGQEETDLLGQIALYDQLSGSLESAEALWRRQLEANRNLSGDRSLQTLRSATFLASVLTQRGAIAEALRLENLALDGFREQVGERDPRTLAARHRIAELLHKDGQIAESIELLRDVLLTRAEVMGRSHRDTFDSASLLAHFLAEQGNLDEAHELAVFVLDGRRRAVGDTHPDTLASMETLANVLMSEGRLDEALALHLEALQGRMATLGEDSPTTLDSMHDVAVALLELGEPNGLEQARALDERVLAKRRRFLGEAAPKTLSTAVNLAEVMRRQGDLQAAWELNTTTLELTVQAYGEDHPDTLTTLNNRGVLLYDRGDIAGARDVFEQVLERRLRVLGEDHLLTLQTASSLGAILAGMGDVDRALRVLEPALTSAKRTLGARHPVTVGIFQNLIGALARSGDRDAARAVLARVAPDGPNEFLG